MTNRYIFIYASVMVTLVALILSAAATLLRPMQERNMRIEKMQSILSTINISASKAEAESMFAEYITTAKVINSKGEEIQGDAFNVNLQDENRKALTDRMLPVFIADVDGKKYYIFPVRGAGLWGPIWGYLSLGDDMSTIVGANFDHKSETPGLGAEIADAEFENQFTGKKIFDETGGFRSVKVVKGRAPADDPHAVDGISGGTITSNGLSNMLYDGLSAYENYINNNRTL
jgi:Na+-transporting NADH:ubiquinone oxidoreductase subunit C